jgi:hypothetical protein
VKLTLERLQLGPNFTMGQLSVDGTFECWVLEDQVRPDGIKVPGETAIPFGTYPVIITWSQRFSKFMPLVCNVPDFEGIRIHSGNAVADTRGCLLVGADRHGNGTVGRSRQAFGELMPKLQTALDNGDTITLEITKPQPGEVVA